MNNKPLSEYLGLSPEAHKETVERDCAVGKIPYESNRNYYVGLEIELENCGREWPPFFDKFPNLYTYHNDGSLRNFGLEIVTVPFNGQCTPQILQDIYTRFALVAPKAQFSPRCSIHVHLDTTDLAAWQYKLLFQLYLIFENQFFAYAGENRKVSNFCIPVNTVDFEDWFPDQVPTWPRLLDTLPTNKDRFKYCGLNVCRTRDIGTMEFRHLPGSFNIKYVTNFINVILDLKRFVLEQQSPQFVEDMILSANTISNYQDICTRIFGRNASILFPEVDFNTIEQGITTAKRMMLDRTAARKLTTFGKVITTPTLITSISYAMSSFEEDNNEQMDINQAQRLKPRRKPRAELVRFEIDEVVQMRDNFDDDEQERDRI